MPAWHKALSLPCGTGLPTLRQLHSGPVAGDIDPAIPPYLMGKGFTAAELDHLMNKQSGFLGLAGGQQAAGGAWVAQWAQRCAGL